MASLIYLDKCTSTNDEIINFLGLNEVDTVSLYTFNQTKGKGQYGNSWQTEENVNIAFSIALPANLIKIQNNLLNFHTALLLANYLAIMTKTPVEVKWPNDLIIRNKKICGILIENKKINGTSYFIIGIGLNVLQEKFEKLTKAGSLRTQTSLRFDLKDLAAGLHQFLTENICLEISAENLLMNLNLNLFRKDQISVFDIKGIRQNGIIKCINTEGFLCVDLEKDGLQQFYHKEIELLY